MNYFQLFEIPVQLKVNRTGLAKKYFELSKRYHPDYYANKSAEEQADALEKSALLNKAFKTLQHHDETIQYVLVQKGLLQEEEKYQLPPAFLMEMMEINEQLAEAKMGGSAETLEQLNNSILQLENEIYAPVTEIVENYQEGITSEKELLQVKEYYFKKKYLQRLREQVKE